MASKILEGAQEALAVARGDTPAAAITTFVGGPYVKDDERPLIQHKTRYHWIIWNWENECWDKCAQKVSVISIRGTDGLSQ